MVTAIAYTNFRIDLESYRRRVNDDADMLLVTNKDPHDNVVVMSADDYDSLMETLRVYRNPGLFDKVRRGMAQVRSGAVASHGLVGGGERCCVGPRTHGMTACIGRPRTRGRSSALMR